MLIWILALIVLGIAGACGYKLGAVRFGVSLVGLILATALAVPLGAYLKPVVPLLGVKNPVWLAVLPPVFAFLIIYLIFIGLSFFVHRKVELYYKYKTEDIQRLAWERLNRALGLWVGLMVGAVWVIILGLIIYVAGYFTVQVASDDTHSVYLRLLNQARQELHSTGLDRAVAPFDPMPPRYYEGSDILGLVYQNPILANRISQYPPFLLLGEKPEVQELAKDTEFNQLLLSKADITEIIKHPKLQGILQNPDIIRELLNQDLKDLRTYLETGVSPKYEEEKILGRWKLDPYATMAQERKKHPDMSSKEMRHLRTVMTEIMPAVSVTATTDKKINIKAEGVADRVRQLFEPPAPAATTPAAPAAPSMDPRMAQRYGRTAAPATPTPAPASTPTKTTEVPYLLLSAQGAWEHEGDKYQLSLQDEKGKSQKIQATADDDRLTVFSPTATLVFAKAD